MCYPVRCANCGTTGWAGCGEHADEVMRSVPASQRCCCHADPVTTERPRAGRRGDPGTRFR